MKGCTDKILDVFVTKDSAEYERQFDDEFLGPVWSVDVMEDGDVIVVNKSTQWVTWSKVPSGPAQLDVGDIVRIGVTGTEGHTGLCTVLQKVRVSRLRNGISHDGPYYNDVIL